MHLKQQNLEDLLRKEGKGRKEKQEGISTGDMLTWMLMELEQRRGRCVNAYMNTLGEWEI